MEVALDGGVKIKSGVKVESVDVAETAILLANGERVLADLIIAADGLHVCNTSLQALPLMTDGSIASQSVVRSHVLDSKEYFPRPSTGQSAIRFMLPKSVAQSDSIMSPAVEDDVHMISWKGNDKRILVYPVDFDQQFNVTCTYPSSLFNRQTSNDSAAVVGMKILAPCSFLIFTVLTLSLRSI